MKININKSINLITQFHKNIKLNTIINHSIKLHINLLEQCDTQYVPYITADGKYYVTLNNKIYYVKRI